MANIILCGNEKDDAIGKMLFNILNKNGEVKHKKTFSKDEYINNKSDCFYIYELEDIPNSSMPGAVLVFKNSFKKNNINQIPNGIVAVLDSQNNIAAQALKGTKNVVITCGMLLKNTLSISSLDFSSAVVSLQRQITTIDSQIIEPHDFAVKLSRNIGVYPILATSATLLLVGVQPLNGLTF